MFESYRTDPLCQAAQRAVDAGIVVVAAAGNQGKAADGRRVFGAVGVPANSPAVIGVGATNTKGTAMPSDDVMATYSSFGPTYIDGVPKPDLVAPGNRIVTAAALGSFMVSTYPERVIAGQGNQIYAEMSGTSMSAPVVAGAAAVLLEAAPSLTPLEVKLALQLTSSRVKGAGVVEAGAGSVNVAAAILFVRRARAGRQHRWRNHR